MTRQEAIEMFGIQIVEQAESDNCDFTNRVTDGTGWQGYTEFVGKSSDCNADGDYCYAYYYQKSEDVDSVEDLGILDWEIDHYDYC